MIGQRYTFHVGVGSASTELAWLGVAPVVWWRTGWGEEHLRRSSPTLLVASRGQGVLMGSIRSPRADPGSGHTLTYDLVLQPDPTGGLTTPSAVAVVLAWWQQRRLPGPWPMGERLDRQLAPHLDAAGITAAGLGASGWRSLPSTDQGVVAERFTWVDAAHPGVPGLLAESVRGTGPSIAYLQVLTPEWAEQIELDSGAVLLVDRPAADSARGTQE